MNGDAYGKASWGQISRFLGLVLGNGTVVSERGEFRLSVVAWPPLQGLSHLGSPIIYTLGLINATPTRIHRNF